MPTCSDLRLGGSLTATGLTGGTSINDYALSIEDWSSILGTGGMTGSVQQVNGRPGGFLSGDLLGRERYPTLNMAITDRDHSGGLTEPTPSEQKQANTDEFLGLVTDPAGNYLELDMPDGTSRFLYVYNLDPAPMRQPRKKRTISIPLVSPMPYWKQGGNRNSVAVNGATNLTVGGKREVHDLILIFSGDGSFTHSQLGWAITITGSTGAVTVDLGTRTVTQGGNPADNLMRRTGSDARKWGWLIPNSTNNVTSTVSVTTRWRDSWA